MTRKAAARNGRKLVWRITDAAPSGEFVHPDAPSKLATQKLAPQDSAWGLFDSSFDLLNGTIVVEGSDTLSPDLLDEIFGPRGDAGNSPPE